MKELIFFQHFHCFVCIFHFTQSCPDAKIFVVDLFLLVCRLLGSKVRETSTVFMTILSFLGIPPCISTTSVLSRRRGRSESQGRGEAAFLRFASTMAQSQILSSRCGCEQWEVHGLVSELQVSSCTKNHLSPRNLQSVYSHSHKIMNFCTGCSIRLRCIH